VKLGHCKQIEEVMIGEDKLIHFSGNNLQSAALGRLCCQRRLLVLMVVGACVCVWWCKNVAGHGHSIGTEAVHKTPAWHSCCRASSCPK
jgi:hypothetical protein